MRTGGLSFNVLRSKCLTAASISATGIGAAWRGPRKLWLHADRRDAVPVGCPRRIPVEQNADAQRQTIGHFHFVAAKQSDIVPAQLPCRQCRISDVQVSYCGGEDSAGNIIGMNAVGADDHIEQFACRFQNRFRRIVCRSCGTTYPTTGH